MSDEQRLEQRLRALAIGPDETDWEDVLRRAGERLPTKLSSRRRLAIALAVAVVVGAALAGSLYSHAGRPASSGPRGLNGPTGPIGPTALRGVTGARGATGANGSTYPEGPTGHGPTGTTRNTGIGPIAYSERNLRAEAHYLSTEIYWAGPREGYRYEFTGRDYAQKVYVRYLPDEVPVGSKGDNFLIVATYRIPDAFAALTKQAGDSAIAGPDGSIIFVRAHDPRSVLLAFPNPNYEIEIYDPSPAVALATAESGDIRPVG